MKVETSTHYEYKGREEDDGAEEFGYVGEGAVVVEVVDRPAGLVQGGCLSKGQPDLWFTPADMTSYLLVDDC